jgi:hypothetical protein
MELALVPLGLPSIPTLASDCQSLLVIPRVDSPAKHPRKLPGYRGSSGDFTSSVLTLDAQRLQAFPRPPRKSVHAYNELQANLYTDPHELSTRPPPLVSYDSRVAECDDCELVVVDPGPLTACQPLMIKGDCKKCGISVVKLIYCGREWCSRCGAPLSDFHQRRIARVKPKVMQMSRLGQLVIEFPDRFRKVPGYAYSAAGLRLAGNAIVDVLAGHRTNRGPRSGGYFSRGWWRWHWFGDQMAGKWNPHANVIFDAGYLPLATLESLKGDLRRELKCRDLIVNYSYRQTEFEMLHTLKYVTRSTFLNEEWDPYMAAQLYRFKNVHYWGKWDGPSVWTSEASHEYEALSKLERGLCPDCDGALEWQKKPLPGYIFESNLRSGWLTALGGGYFKLKIPTAFEEFAALIEKRS